MARPDRRPACRMQDTSAGDLMARMLFRVGFRGVMEDLERRTARLVGVEGVEEVKREKIDFEVEVGVDIELDGMSV